MLQNDRSTNIAIDLALLIQDLSFHLYKISEYTESIDKKRLCNHLLNYIDTRVEEIGKKYAEDEE